MNHGEDQARQQQHERGEHGQREAHADLDDPDAAQGKALIAEEAERGRTACSSLQTVTPHRTPRSSVSAGQPTGPTTGIRKPSTSAKIISPTSKPAHLRCN